MNPVELIKRDLGSAEWARACEAWAEESVLRFREDLSLFREYKIYVVRGKTGQFDFPSLPRGSYGYYAVNGREALRLTRAGKEVERILAEEWASLPSVDPVKLASFLLSFYDGGIKETHSVLGSADQLRECEKPTSHYRLDRNLFAEVLPRIGVTSSGAEPRAFVLRAITLCGWMHRKGNLGIETLTITRDGVVVQAPRVVLAESIFTEFPAIMY